MSLLIKKFTFTKVLVFRILFMRISINNLTNMDYIISVKINTMCRIITIHLTVSICTFIDYNNNTLRKLLLNIVIYKFQGLQHQN